MIYEIINPSDPYTIEADDSMIAAVAVLLLGSGQLALEDETGNDVLPLLLFGGVDKWITENVGDINVYIDQHHTAIAVALDTILIGSAKDRAFYHEAERLIDDPMKKRELWESWHDKRRSSLNDIGAAAHRLVGVLRKSNGVEDAA
jgi:hypothetical protein